MNFGSKKLYINGQLVEASDQSTYDIVCPGNEKKVAQISWASASDAEVALQSAQKGFKYWSNLNLEERILWINKLREKILGKRDVLRTSIMYEVGKTWAGTEEDVTSLTDSLKFYADEIRNKVNIPIKDKEGTHEHFVTFQPLGVVVAFLAYNFPLLNLGFKLGPALAAGCSIIIKPSEFSPLSAYILGEICHEIGFPDGVINILCGDVRNVGIPLCESKIPQLITMIGSTETAQKLIEQSSRTSIKRYSMECGGNAPFIVLEDADLSQAIDLGAGLKIGNSGQICVAPNRYYIHEDILNDFVDGMVNKFNPVQLGFGKDSNPDMGPLANKASVDKVHRIVEEAINQGGELKCGGQALDKPGYYYPPTVILMSDQNAPIFHEEIFGPVALIIPFNDKEEVLQFANSTEGGLASYVFSNDEEILSYFAEHLEFGEVQLNGIKYDIYLPHGGIKNSGIGVDCSEYALDDYLIMKRVSKKLPVSTA